MLAVALVYRTLPFAARGVHPRTDVVTLWLIPEDPRVVSSLKGLPFPKLSVVGAHSSSCDRLGNQQTLQH